MTMVWSRLATSTSRLRARLAPVARPFRPLRPVGRAIRRVLRVLTIVLLSLAAVGSAAATWGILATTVEHPAPPPIVNDVTQLNPIAVSRVITPTTTEEIVDAVRRHQGPIAIGGGRYSMGGQTATEQALQIDMRRFNRILSLDSVSRTITVQAGTRWRQIQERIDPANLSVKIMQTYANFTVGGSMSVNVHGRYIGMGPLILSVRSFRIVLADGSVVEASRTENPEIFFGAIGGYGGLGVITEATLDLAENVRVKRLDRTMPVTEYRRWFATSVRDSSKVVFHNGDIYPPEYERVNAVTFERTEDPVTIPDRLIPAGQPYRLNRFVYWVMSEWVGGKEIREHVIDPLIFRGEPVSWRNHEASYDVAELEPASRDDATYVLQEYFVPVDRFDEFVPTMRGIFTRHDVNVINVSIRHAMPDPGAILAWARGEVFAFVVYYKQETDEAARREVGVWTRELIDAVTALDGSYYLPYQPHATDAQFLRAYPRAPDFFALKRRLDPTNKFRNTLWDKYYLPRVDPRLAQPSPDARAVLDTMATYRRDEGQTFLTHPEWYIVYSSDEYAAWMKDSLPTNFPYVEAIGQFWVNYGEARRLTERYPPNAPYHVMLGVIGSSYTVEMALKGIYENSVGRFSGWTADHQLSDEDRFAYAVASDYGRFIHVRPWYEYPFGTKLADLWTKLPWGGDHLFRKWERRFFLSLELGIKAGYANVIEFATRSAYTPQADRMELVVAGWPDSLAGHEERITPVARLDSVHTLIATPRYDVFRDVIIDLARAGSTLPIAEIAGNDDILLTGVAPAAWRHADGPGTVAYALELPSDPSRKRFAMRVPVRSLIPVVRRLVSTPGVSVDHIYDY